MIQKYDPANVEHEQLLAALFDLVFPPGSSDRQEANMETLHSVRWIDVGFQQKNPRTDFRGGGMLSLHCIYYIAAYKPEFLKEMKVFGLREENQGIAAFFPAITIINVTHRLLCYLYMHKDNVPFSHTSLQAGRVQFKTFCQLND